MIRPNFLATGRVSILVVATVALAGCGTYQLAGSIQAIGKSAEQQQLDTLTCKDQARLAANTADRQVGAFLLGMTIVGTPVAFELEKAKQREVFASCMTARGYAVTPPSDGNGQATASPAALPASAAASAPRTLPDGTTFQRLSFGTIEYPPAALAQKVTGTVVAEFDIAVDGTTSNVTIFSRDLTSQAPDMVALFDNATLSAVRQSRWKVTNPSAPNRVIRSRLPLYFALPDVAKPVPTPSMVGTAPARQPTLSADRAGAEVLQPPVAPNPPAVASTTSKPLPSAGAGMNVKDEAIQLEKIKGLKDRGLITEEEYATKRKAILDGI
jgi:hypothetical protein